MTKKIVALMSAIVCGFCAFAAITIDPASRTFAKTGGAGSILTSGTGSWSATTDVDWIEIKPRTSGDAGVSCVYVVSKNPSADTRVGHVTVAGNVHTVTQEGYDAILTPEAASVDLNGGTGTVGIQVDAGVTWSVVCDVDWVSFSVVSGVGPQTISYEANPYDGIVARSASIKIAGKVFVLNQTGIDVQLTPDFAYVECDAGIVEVVVRAMETTKWNVALESDWVSIADGETGRGDSNLLIAYAANDSFSERETKVKVGSATFLLRQKGVAKVEVSISPTSGAADPNGGYGIVDVTATRGGPWTAKSFASWLTLANDSGIGSGLLEYVASPNLTLEPREGYISVMPYSRTPNPDLYAGLVYWRDSSSQYYPKVFDNDCLDRSDLQNVGWETSSAWENAYMSFTGGKSYSIKGIPLDCLSGADGFAMSISLKLKNSEQINRIASVGNLALYLNAENRICINDNIGGRVTAEEMQEMLIAFTQTVDGNVRVFAGGEGSELRLVLECQGEFAFDLEKPIAGQIVFGRTVIPSEGWLTGATSTTFCFWNRKLDDVELKTLGTGLVQRQLPWYENIVASKWVCLPLDGNATFYGQGYRQYYSNSPSSWSRIYGTGIASATDRFGVPGRALACKYRERSLSKPDRGVYMKGVNDLFYQDTAECCVSFWFCVQKWPSQDQPIFAVIRDHRASSGSSANYIDDVAVLSTEGGVKIKSPTSTSGLINVSLGEWHMLTLTGGPSFLTVFVDGDEKGNFTFANGLGAFMCSDIRSDMCLGRFDGFVDDFYVGVKATGTQLVSAYDVKRIYEKSRPDIKKHFVSQGVIVPSLQPSRLLVDAGAGTHSTELTLGKGVAWTARSNDAWVKLKSASSGTGSAKISFDVEANPRAERRFATIDIAGLTLTIEQKALWSEVENDTPFPPVADGGYGFITVTTEGDALWQAVSDADWLTIIDEGDHAGTGSAMWSADPYNDTTQSRMATITVADHKVYITQRGYELSVEPQGVTASSLGATGQIEVRADRGDAMWSVVVTEPWIHIVSQQTGVGDGTVRYSLDDNLSGESRSGKIIVSGAEYEIVQTPRLILSTEVIGHGIVSGGGEYEVGQEVTLTAKADQGYVFASWDGAVFGTLPTLTVKMDSAKKVSATFIPESAAQQIVKDRGASTEGLYTKEQMHGLGLGNLVIDVDDLTGKARIGLQLLSTTDLSNPKWEPVAGLDVKDMDVEGSGIVGVQVPATGNAKFFKVVSPNE